MKRKFNRNVIFFLFIFMLVIGKFVRYTIMKDTLVEPGIGHYMITDINNNNVEFNLTLKGNSSTDETSSASDNATFFFYLINFFDLDTYGEYEIYITIVWNLILLLLLLNMRTSLTIFQALFVLLSISVLNIFDFCLAKEPVQFLFFLIMYLIIISNIKNDLIKKIGVFGVILISAIVFRIYYIIIAMFFLFIIILFEKYIVKLKKISWKNILFILVMIALFYFVFLNIAKYIAPVEYAELIRVRLRTSSAASDMRAIFHSDNLIIFSFDYLIMIVRMLVPIELLRLGPKYLLYVIYQVFITVILIKNILNYKNINSEKKIALYLYIAFLMGSASFEPDFGSWIRHEAVVIPILLILSDIIKSKKEKNNGEVSVNNSSNI